MGSDNYSYNDFDFINFEKSWTQLDQDQQCYMLESVSEFSPSQSIHLIIAGLSSYHYLLRNKAREALNTVQNDMIIDLNSLSDSSQYRNALQESDYFCYKLFLLVKSGIGLSELNFYFQTLIRSKGKGPYYAWRICYSGIISMHSFKALIPSLSEQEKLVLTIEYLESSPQIRREWAPEFKRVLKTINNKIEIINFLSDIFDKHLQVDPFLFNIPILRNTDNFLIDDLKSFKTKNIIKIIKAASLIYDSLDSDLLLKYLNYKDSSAHKLVALEIIEFSPIDTYSQPLITNCLLDIFKHSSSHEAFLAFKALVITRSVPLYKLFVEVIKSRKDILLDVLDEISSFSRISFLITQDVAQNKKEYLKHNALVFKALILGITRKRPDRVIKIIKKFEDSPDDQIRTQVLSFIELISQFLKNEKISIDKEIKSLINKVNKLQNKKSGFLKGLFLSETDKKLVELKESKIPKEFDFEHDIIEDVDLSNMNHENYILFFNAATIKNSSFSGSIIENSFFQHAIIYQADFSNAEFDSVCFDNAILIDVKANNAKFTNCSFFKTSIYNSDFDSSDLHNSTFTGSKIVKTSFNQTNLSGVSFVTSEFTFVSFIDSVLSLTDLTGLTARFSKFDDFTESTILSTSADFSAQAFKLNLDSIPYFKEEIISRIEMLIFVEFLYYGEQIFIKKNKLSRLIAFDIYKKKQGDLFELIPLLLHENIVFPGGGTIVKNCPHGISKYLPSNELISIARKYLSIQNLKFRKNDKGCIEALYTIGSTGSLAQTTQSDFDFWVIIKDDSFTEKMKKQLKLKLRQIEIWADKEFNTEVNFFILDINKALNNDFGTLSFESSGSAQARLLKEEFYRTIIYVAGKIPLWTVLPVSISVHYYNDINNLIEKTSVDSKYINLGDIHGIPSGEYFGASIWHMYKLLKSPFKSVIKMALLEKFIYEYGKEPLLCNKIKDIWINSGNQLKLVNCDSYYILINELIKYYESIEDQRSVNLIQVCFFLKVQISKKADFENTLFGIREQFINKLILDWSMKPERIFEIGNYKNWEYIAIERLSSTIESYMIGKMRMMNKAFENAFQNDAKISPEERTVLVRNIVVEFSKGKNKIERVLLVSRNLTYFKRLSLQPKEVNKKTTWELVVDPKTARHSQKDVLKQAGTIEEIAAWLINNSFYSEQSTISLVPNPSFVTYNDIVRLMKAMHDFFTPIMQKQKSFHSLVLEAKIVAVFVSFNLCVNPSNPKINEYTIIYLNSWNEMFIYSKINNKGFDSVKEVVEDILTMTGIKRLPKQHLIFSPKAFWGEIEKWQEYLSKIKK
jgi:adenylate cyclase, class 1